MWGGTESLKKKKKKLFGWVCEHDICRVNSNRVHRMLGAGVSPATHWSCHLLGPKTITFQKGSCGAFRLMCAGGVIVRGNEGEC